MKHLLLILALIVAPVAPLWAVNPDEILADPVLESRARDISQGLRCVVCRGENIDESNADIARDMRLLVRERLLEGDTNTQVMDYVVERYGEFVLMKPTSEGANKLLWAAGPILFLLAALTALVYLRGRARSGEKGAETLSESEQARLEEILKG